MRAYFLVSLTALNSLPWLRGWAGNWAVEVGSRALALGSVLKFVASLLVLRCVAHVALGCVLELD